MPLRNVLIGSLAVAALVAPLTVGGQIPSSGAESSLGRVAGRVLDAVTGQGISDATVVVAGYGLRTVSGLDGRYVLAGIPAGVHTLEVRRIGYRPKTVTSLDLTRALAVQLDVTLEPATVQLAATVVTASAERGSVAELVDLQ
ncbi:MAG TPA: carboxypeptidase-like regulatory domain-containing protein, partial [Gemmatimonadaceae bacterium]|nr:carboxypeptidase-like regulatory domain-containing protein [Gemmatimonadaceae bacterium]